MKGMMGSSGTFSRPSVSVIFSGIDLLLLLEWAAHRTGD
jgi:hypothetical protein